MRYLLFLILMVSTSLTAGTIHKWVDENGNVHYSDAPPVSARTENVRVQSKPSNTGKALPRLNSSADPQQAAAGSTNDKQKQEQAKMVCENARQDLQVISATTRVRLKEPDGSSRFLTPEEIADRKAQAEADVKKYCQ